jgi:hypothetical protein
MPAHCVTTGKGTQDASTVEAAMSKLHLVFLWLFVLWLGDAGVTTFRLPFLVVSSGFSSRTGWHS